MQTAASSWHREVLYSLKSFSVMRPVTPADALKGAPTVQTFKAYINITFQSDIVTFVG